MDKAAGKPLAVSQDKRCTPSSGPAPAPVAGRGLQLVHNALELGGAAGDAPAQWRDALGVLMASEQTEICWTLPQPSARMRTMRRLAGRPDAAESAPLFAPWRTQDPADLQAPAGLATGTVPRGRWLASYLFDCGADRPAQRPVIDLMVLSAHPSACLMDDDCGFALPRAATLAAMFDAISAEGRARIAMITPQRSASALARRLLASGRGNRRTDCKIEIVTIEDALGPLMAGAPGWDALIVAPQLRSIVLAILGEATGLAGPHPLLWYDARLTMICAESLRPHHDHQPLDVALLVQSLALAARHNGQMPLAQRLFSGWARLRESGAATPSRGSAAPYATILDEAELIARIPAIRDARGRPAPLWQALGSQTVQKRGNNPPLQPVGLKLVASQ